MRTIKMTTLATVLVLLIPTTAGAGGFVARAFEEPEALCVADIDGDGDQDTVGAAQTSGAVLWFENVQGDGGAWAARTVDYTDDTEAVAAGDIDGDGVIDVVSSGSDIDWHENTAGDGTAWTEHQVVDSWGARDLTLVDLDGDTDLDIIAAAQWEDTVAWFENIAGDGSAWTQHDIDTTIDHPWFVDVGDLDGDTDLDLIAVAWMGDHVTWYENTAGDASTWTPHLIEAFDSGREVRMVDLDGDGSLDVVAASDGDGMRWWDNTAGDGSAWTPIQIFQTNSESVDFADIDGDQDLDVFVPSSNGVSWAENTAGDGSAWDIHTIDNAVSWADEVRTIDVDGDGDGNPDLVASSSIHGWVHCYANVAGDGTSWASDVVGGLFNIDDVTV